MPEPLPDATPEVLDRVEAAATADGLIRDPLAPSASPATNDSQGAESATPQGADGSEGATQEDSFSKFDPNSLSPELRQVYASMQGDYTRKMQEIAPWRGLQEELGIASPDEIRQAAELYAHLQDQNNLAEFVRRATEALGLGQPAPAATPSAEPANELDDLEFDSAKLIKPLEEKLAALQQRLDQQAQNEEVERAYYARVGEVVRQEALLAEQNPHWQEDDWTALYTLAPAFEGDLVQTANALESFASARLANYVSGKIGTAEQPGLQPAPAPRNAEVPVDTSGEEDPLLRGATDQARSYLRNLLSQSE